MIRRPAAFIVLFLAMSALASGAPPEGRDAGSPDGAGAANKKLGRGINLGNALEAPKEGEWGVTLKADYFEPIKEAGFDSVRIPIRWSAHAAAEAPYAIDAEFSDRVDWAIDRRWPTTDLIVNVHHYDGMDAIRTSTAAIVGLWEQIAARYKDRPERLVFELLNEPHDKLTDEKWQEVSARVLAAVPTPIRNAGSSSGRATGTT